MPDVIAGIQFVDGERENAARESLIQIWRYLGSVTADILADCARADNVSARLIVIVSNTRLYDNWGGFLN